MWSDYIIDMILQVGLFSFLFGGRSKQNGILAVHTFIFQFFYFDEICMRFQVGIGISSLPTNYDGYISLLMSVIFAYSVSCVADSKLREQDTTLWFEASVVPIE
jgi:hypothetical protein